MNISSKSYSDNEIVLKSKTHLIGTNVFFQHKHKDSVKH